MTTRSEMDTIIQIAIRAERFYRQFDIKDDRLTIVMDLDNAHTSVPLDLDAFLNFDDSNFAHDMLGIRNHMDRQNGVLTGCFLPRCAKVQHA